VTKRDSPSARSIPTALALSLAGLALGFVVSEWWTVRDDYSMVVGIAVAWVPAVIFVMRRFPPMPQFGRQVTINGAMWAVVMPLGRAVPESWSIAGGTLAVGLVAGCVVAIVHFALPQRPKPGAPDCSPAFPR
jgi:hypothetical protein